jgi:hypothetical protein
MIFVYAHMGKRPMILLLVFFVAILYIYIFFVFVRLGRVQSSIAEGGIESPQLFSTRSVHFHSANHGSVLRSTGAKTDLNLYHINIIKIFGKMCHL